MESVVAQGWEDVLVHDQDLADRIFGLDIGGEPPH